MQFKGTGKFLSQNEVLVQPADGSEELIISAQNFVVATGSSPRVHPKIEADGKVIHTSDTIQTIEKCVASKCTAFLFCSLLTSLLRRLPKSLVILGAGVVGCEYATIFSNLKETKVYVIDKALRILPAEDEDVASAVSRRMEEKGVVIHHNAVLKYMKKTPDNMVEYVIEHPGENITEKFVVEMALLSIGRCPNLSGLGLEEIGVKLDQHGNLITNKCQTSVPNVWAAGDATIDVALVNIAENGSLRCF
jgi:dihydrolipoamide dehydrogenase